MQTVEAKPQPVRREFWIYFSVVYAMALPVAFLQWLSRLVLPGKPGESRRSVFGAAYATAWRITPQIFSAQ